MPQYSLRNDDGLPFALWMLYPVLLFCFILATAAIDSMIANLTTALEAKGMADNLVVVYSADNGGAPEGGTNWPWKGTK